MRTIDFRATSSGHAAPITHVAFRGDGRRLATCSYDGTVIVWDTSDPCRPVRTACLRHRRLVNSSAWNPRRPDVLATASADKTVAVWEVSDAGRVCLVNVLARHTDDINSVAWMPDGERLICVSEDGRATMWQARDGAFVAEVGSHAAHCMMVSVSRGGLVATVGEDGLVAVLDPDSGAGPTTRSYASSIEGCAWSHGGRALAVTRDDGVVDLLGADLDLRRSIQVSTSAARCVDWSEDDSVLVVGAYDGSLHVLDVEGQLLRRIDDPRIWPRSVSVAGSVLAAGSFWSSPHMFDLLDGRELAAPAEPTHGPNALARLGDELVVGCDSGTVLALDLPSATTRPRARVMGQLAGPVLTLAVHGEDVFAGTYSGHVERLGERPATSQPLGAPVPSLCAADGTLVAGTYNGELVRLSPSTLEVVERHEAHGGSVKALVTVPGGFLAASTDRTVSAGAGLADREVLWQHGNLLNAVAVLGGDVVATASRDHTVKVGRVAAGAQDGGVGLRVAQQRTLLGPDESVKCVALLGDPRAPVVVAGSYDFGLYAWEVDLSEESSDGAGTLASGRLLYEFRQGLSAALPWDGDRLVVAGWDGTVLVVGPDLAGEVSVLAEAELPDLLLGVAGDGEVGR